MVSSPILFASTVVLSLLFMMHEGETKPTSGSTYIKYTTVTGYFMQDDPATNPATFDYVKSNLGLIDQKYDTDSESSPDDNTPLWRRFYHKVETLNQEAPENVQYKVLYMARHGEGYHNVAESYYGTPAWNCYWSLLNGNGTLVWEDANVTPKGEQQALVAHGFWKDALTRGIPPPETYYSSPLQRCLITAKLTFSGLELPKDQPFIPTIKELLREGIGIHTCDRRHPKSWIASHFPTFKIEPDFSEEDHLWLPDLRESDTALVVRMKKLLDDIFTHDGSTFISFTAHSGAIEGLLTALNHQRFRLATGGVIPVLIKAETVEGEEPTRPVDPW